MTKKNQYSCEDENISHSLLNNLKENKLSQSNSPAYSPTFSSTPSEFSLNKNNEMDPQTSEQLELNRIISNLKLITTLPAGHKLAIRNNKLIIHSVSSWNDWGARIYNGDNRLSTMTYLENMTSDILKILKKETINENQRNRLFKEIKQSTTGLKNLQNAYWTDAQVKCQLDTIIENLNEIN